MDDAQAKLVNAENTYNKSGNDENKSRLQNAEAAVKMAKYYEDSI